MRVLYLGDVDNWWMCDVFVDRGAVSRGSAPWLSEMDAVTRSTGAREESPPPGSGDGTARRKGALCRSRQ